MKLKNPEDRAQERNRLYKNFVASCRNNAVTVKDIARFGAKCMRQAKLHPHFLADHSLKSTALYLAFFALNLPYEYTNPQCWVVKSFMDQTNFQN